MFRRVSVCEPVGVVAEGDDFGVVDEPVDHGGGDYFVAEDFAPPSERLLGGDDQAGTLIAAGDELEDQVGRLGFERDEADLIDHQHGLAAEPKEFGLQASAAVGVGELGDPLTGGGEQYRCSSSPDRARLASTGRIPPCGNPRSCRAGPIVPKDAGLYERLDQGQDALVCDSQSHGSTP
jgi:hypothetical protein